MFTCTLRNLETNRSQDYRPMHLFVLTMPDILAIEIQLTLVSTSDLRSVWGGANSICNSFFCSFKSSERFKSGVVRIAKECKVCGWWIKCLRIKLNISNLPAGEQTKCDILFTERQFSGSWLHGIICNEMIFRVNKELEWSHSITAMKLRWRWRR